MVIGFDASRAFIEGRTGTENYSYQLLKALAKIDGSTSLTTGTENKDRARTSVEEIIPRPRRTLPFVDAKRDYLIYLRPNTVIPAPELESSGIKAPGSRIKSGMTNNGWPANFHFKVLNYPRLWTQVGLGLQTFIDPLDVLFVPSHTLPLIRKPGLKTVITVHDLGSEYLPGLHQLKQVLYLKLMTYYQLKTASKIIAVSEATKTDLMKKIGIPSEKIKIVYEGVGEEFSMQYAVGSMKRGKVNNDAVSDIVKKYDIQREKYFLFVGTIQPRKNLERLIVAFSRFLSQTDSANERTVLGSKYYVSRGKRHNTKYIIPNTTPKLVLVGQKGWKSDSIYKLPKELGIEDRVLFTGRISDEDLVGLYNGATALVYPSLFEGFGLPIIEAFACGCPVITSNVSSMPEVAGEAAVFVNPYNVQDIAEAMIKIVKDDSFRSSLIKKGIVRAGQFSWEKCARETLQILQNVVGNRE